MQIIWVACGGAIGASLRYVCGQYWFVGQVFPWATFLINTLGCALAGVWLALSLKYPSLNAEWRLLFMVGVLGGFTTFSSFSLEWLQLMRQGVYGLAMGYVALSVLTCLIGVSLGFILTRTSLQFF